MFGLAIRYMDVSWSVVAILYTSTSQRTKIQLSCSINFEYIIIIIIFICSDKNT